MLLDISIQLSGCSLHINVGTKLNSVALVHTRTIPTERLLPVGEMLVLVTVF